MKAATVALVVDAIADWQGQRSAATFAPNMQASADIRLAALESLLDTLSEAMLEGTSADPDRKKR